MEIIYNISILLQKMKIEMCVYGEDTLRHKIVRYLIQMYIDIAGGYHKRYSLHYVPIKGY